jgi:hypothetical protein
VDELKPKPVAKFRRRPLPRTKRKRRPITIPRPINDGPPQTVRDALAWLLPLGWRKP